jgi:hypothetical protein
MPENFRLPLAGRRDDFCAPDFDFRPRRDFSRQFVDGIFIVQFIIHDPMYLAHHYEDQKIYNKFYAYG